jgi:hypothetical protein
MALLQLNITQKNVGLLNHSVNVFAFMLARSDLATGTVKQKSQEEWITS